MAVRTGDSICESGNSGWYGYIRYNRTIVLVGGGAGYTDATSNETHTKKVSLDETDKNLTWSLFADRVDISTSRYYLSTGFQSNKGKKVIIENLFHGAARPQDTYEEVLVDYKAFYCGETKCCCCVIQVNLADLIESKLRWSNA